MNKQGAYILIVDDEIEIIRALQRSLTAHGYKVFTARNGEDAVKLTLQQRPDVLLLDLVLPDMSGLEVCRKIREGIQCANYCALGQGYRRRQGSGARSRG